MLVASLHFIPNFQAFELNVRAPIEVVARLHIWFLPAARVGAQVTAPGRHHTQYKAAGVNNACDECEAGARAHLLPNRTPRFAHMHAHDARTRTHGTLSSLRPSCLAMYSTMSWSCVPLTMYAGSSFPDPLGARTRSPTQYL